MTDRIRMAHIGVSYPHGVDYIDSMLLMPEVEVAGLYDSNLSTAKTMIPDTLQNIEIYTDLDTMLEKERPEAVVITQPNDVTPKLIKKVAEAGVHIFAEKPCARTASELLSILQSVRKTGVQFATGYTRRVSPAGIAIKKMIEDGVLGQLMSIEASWITTSVKMRDPKHPMFSKDRNGGGILHWLGCHWLDFMRWATGSEVTEVAAIMDTLSGESIDVEDTAALSLRYDNGMIGSLHCSYVTDSQPHQLFFGLRGSDGWLRWDYMGCEVEVRSAHPNWSGGKTKRVQFNTDFDGGYERGDGIAILRRFIQSFKEDIIPVVTMEDALRILEILDASRLSAESGTRIKPSRAQYQ